MCQVNILDRSGEKKEARLYFGRQHVLLEHGHVCRSV